MSDEPLFDPSLKKRKKKAVAFTEDPLGADADPTAPAPEFIDNTTTNGDAVDLGPATAHEQMKKEDDDFKAMFGDMKKKKKKKEIPVDLVSQLAMLYSSNSTRARTLKSPTFQTSRRRRKAQRKRPSTWKPLRRSLTMLR